MHSRTTSVAASSSPRRGMKRTNRVEARAPRRVLLDRFAPASPFIGLIVLWEARVAVTSRSRRSCCRRRARSSGGAVDIPLHGLAGPHLGDPAGRADGLCARDRVSVPLAVALASFAAAVAHALPDPHRHPVDADRRYRTDHRRHARRIRPAARRHHLPDHVLSDRGDHGDRPACHARGADRTCRARCGRRASAKSCTSGCPLRCPTSSAPQDIDHACGDRRRGGGVRRRRTRASDSSSCSRRRSSRFPRRSPGSRCSSRFRWCCSACAGSPSAGSRRGRCRSRSGDSEH